MPKTTITFPSLLMIAFHFLSISSQSFAEETFQKILISEAWKTSNDDLTITTKMSTPNGHKEEKTGESTIYLKRGDSEKVMVHGLLNGVPGKVLLTDAQKSNWSDDYSSRGHKPFKSAEEKWGYLCTRHMREFILIPSTVNATFLDKNFKITKVDTIEGKNTKVLFELAEEPTDRILKIFSEQKATFAGVLEIDPETRFVSSLVMDLVRGEHKRHHEVTATYKVGELDDKIFTIPAEVSEKIDKMLERAKEREEK